MKSLTWACSLTLASLSYGSSAYAQGNFMFESDAQEAVGSVAPVSPKATAAPKVAAPPKVATPSKIAASPKATEAPKITAEPKAPAAAQTQAPAPAPAVPAKPAAPEGKIQTPKPNPQVADTKMTPAKVGTPDGCSNNFEKASALIKAVHGKDVELSRIGEFTGVFRGVNASNRFKNSGGSLLLNIAVEPMINTDVPVKICKRGDKVTAELITAKALEADSHQPQAMIVGMVASGDAPRAITLNVRRNGQQLNFNGSSGSITVQATAAIR